MKVECYHLTCDEGPDLFAQAKRFLGKRIESVRSRGNGRVLRRPKLALFSSRKCPGDIILKTFDLAQSLRNQGVTVIGGFHSPMEQECLRILLRGEQPVIICPARSIDRMRVRPEWEAPMAEGRLLLLSPFAPEKNRVSAERAQVRNRFVAAVADAIFIAYAESGGNAEALAREAVKWNKSLFTFDSPNNDRLMKLGFRPVCPDSFALNGEE